MAKPKQGSLPLTGGSYLYKDRRSGYYEVHPTNETSMTLLDCERMASHHTIAQAMSVVESIYVTRDWRIKGKDKKKAAIIEKAIRAHWNRLGVDVLKALKYGFAPFYIDWQDKGGLVQPASILPLKPHYISPLVDEHGAFAGFEQEFFGGQVNSTRYIPRENCFIYTYDFEFGDFRGKPRFRAARFAYTVYKYIIEMANIFYENFADPAKVGYAPSGKGMSDGGDLKFNTVVMRDILKQGAVGGSKDYILPSEEYEKGGKKWDIKLLESSRNGGEYIEYLKYLEQKMAHGVLVPELAFSQTGAGSYNLGDLHAAHLAYRSDMDMMGLAYFIETYLINPIVEYNWGADELNEYKMDFTKTSERDRDMIKQVVFAAMQNSKVKPDWEQISRMTGIEFTEDFEATAKLIEAKEKPIVKPEVEKPVKLEKCSCKHEQLELNMPKRSYTKAEEKVNFTELNNIYDGAEEIFKRVKTGIDGIEARLIAKAKNAFDNQDVNKLKNLSLDNKAPYLDRYEDEMLNILDTSFSGVVGELKLGDKKMKTLTRTVEATKAREMAQKQLSDMEFGARNILLSAAANDVGWELAQKQLKDFFTDYIDKVKVGVNISVQEFVDDGRRTGADDPDVILAQWSAVLDSALCPMCEELDGMTTEINSDFYNEFTPGNMHPNCRCVWVYITKDEVNPPEVDAERPDDELINSYLRK